MWAFHVRCERRSLHRLAAVACMCAQHHGARLPTAPWRAMQERDPLPAFRAFCAEHKLLSEDDFKAIDADVTEVVDGAVEFADESPRPEKGQLLENVFADPKGFGIAPDGEYRYTKPAFTSGAVSVS
jgi:hypothetical protein